MKKILLLFIVCVFSSFLISFAFQNTQKSSGSATVQQSIHSDTLSGELESPQNSDDGVLDPPKVQKKPAATKATIITPVPTSTPQTKAEEKLPQTIPKEERILPSQETAPTSSEAAPSSPSPVLDEPEDEPSVAPPVIEPTEEAPS